MGTSIQKTLAKTVTKSWIRTGVVAVGVVAWAGPSVAAACSSPGLEEHRIDDTLTDDTPPLAVGDVDVVIRRGKAPECRLGQCSSTSCDDVGSVELSLAPPQDDQGEDAALGYQIELVDGEAPEGLIPDFTFRTFDAPGVIRLSWADGATDDQEALEFSIVIRAVDAAGNVGPASDPIEIADPGGSASGCSVAPRGGGPVALLLLLAVGALGRGRSPL